MKAEITALNEYIQSLGLISSFGGFCINMQDKELPYGIDGAGKVYTTDDYLGTIGYSYIKSIRNHSTHGFVLDIGINIFVSPKAIGEVLPIYELPMFIYQKLKAHYKDISFENYTYKKFSHYEMSTISIKLHVYSICDELELKSKIC